MMCGRRQNLRCGFFEGECNTDCQCCILLRHDEGKLRGHLGTWCAVQRQAIPRAGVSRQPVYVTGTGYKRRDQEICVGLGHPHPHLRWSPESHMDRDCCATSDPHGKDQWLLWDESEAPALGPSPEGGVVQRHFRHRLYTRLGRLLFKERGGVEVAGEDRPDCTSVQRKLPTFDSLELLATQPPSPGRPSRRWLQSFWPQPRSASDPEPKFVIWKRERERQWSQAARKHHDDRSTVHQYDSVGRVRHSCSLIGHR
jgi:hypothetical protein